ncbi:MAG: signal peptidase II [Clostridia bacterium]|nr:signal peptidase II [Clostridia bacterium]
MILLIAIIVGAVALDQLTKWLAVIYLEGEASFPLWQDVLHFTYARNEGAAFGMLRDQRWIFMVFSAVAIIGLLIYLIFFRPKSRYVQITLAMIVGGGIGNMIDRICLGYVIDFIDFTLIDFAIFNVADSFVTVGAFMLMGYLIVDIIRDTKAEKAKKEKRTLDKIREEPTATADISVGNNSTENDNGTGME